MRRLPDLDPYLEHLARLLPGVTIRAMEPRPGGRGRKPMILPDAELEFRVRGQAIRLHVDVKRTHLATAVTRAIVGALGDVAPQWLLLAPYIGRPLGRFLEEHGLNYLDLRGNCHLRVGDQLVAHVEGRAREGGDPRPKGVRAAGVRALFALLADPALLATTGREIARAAGTTHATALGAVRRLADGGGVVVEGRERRWMPGGLRIGLERWIDEYETVLRPALLVGTYRTPDRTPPELDRRVADLLAQTDGVRWGGAAAAHRVVPHHRGARTVLHVPRDVTHVLRALRAVPDPRGPLVVLGLPGPLGERGVTHDTAHPLLVYAEMLHGADDRTMEAAALFRERTLGTYS